MELEPEELLLVELDELFDPPVSVVLVLVTVEFDPFGPDPDGLCVALEGSELVIGVNMPSEPVVAVIVPAGVVWPMGVVEGPSLGVCVLF